MELMNINIPVEVLGYDELTPDEADLVEEAKQATYRSYAPYSHFKVGAAIELENGIHVTGSNQENAAFSSGTCAERSACFYAHSQYPEVPFKTIAIAARAADDLFVADPIPPCGSCRQSLLEYENLHKKNVKVLLAGREKVYRLESLHALMPLAFTEF